tara:strand:+ start:521 stop:691 length:171 start_codon:yes stop_codon:yes gene_type:complete
MLSTASSEVYEDGYHWPINEIILESHLLSGATNADIARTYHVQQEEVTALRRVYGL